MTDILVIHGGGPTPVINSSLYGVLRAAKASGQVRHVYGAIGGAQAVLSERWTDLMKKPQAEIEGLLHTPASAIGTSRYPLEDKHYADMVAVLKRRGITCVLLNGGNGTMDTCGKLAEACAPHGICVVGIPKTIDNDIAITDHTPGYGSAARYLAHTVREIGQDVRSLPIHVCVVEALGRNAGWITAASALARDGEGSAPHLIYLPEKPFDEEAFLADVQRLWDKRQGVVVVVSEGLRGQDGQPIVPPIFKTDRATYYGDVSAHLAQLVIRRLGIKARSEKPGLAGRASIAYQSPVDRDEAIQVGEEAVRAALAGESGIMIGLERLPGAAYAVRTARIPVREVMLHERTVPDAFIAPAGNDVTQAFIDWARPLLGEPLPTMTDWTREESL